MDDTWDLLERYPKLFVFGTNTADTVEHGAYRTPYQSQVPEIQAKRAAAASHVQKMKGFNTANDRVAVLTYSYTHYINDVATGQKQIAITPPPQQKR